ncbi:hypothetical protein TKK_0015043 [Trichogramma kaykai]|uniref:Replication protein A OB domain-containing protein n=1 Tax=Trichogramma kaykai TaxID=54128 RepID=A0ABD2WCT0_9HYME
MDNTYIQRVDANIKCKELKINSADLAAIPKLSKNEIITTTATLQAIGPQVEFFSKKKQKKFSKKELELINDKNFKIILTLWGEKSNTELDKNRKYIFKNVTVYNGNYCVALNSTHITEIEKLPEDSATDKSIEKSCQKIS